MRNLISGNRGNGIYITGTGSCNNITQGNWIGLDASGRRALTNAYSEIYISGPGNLIGGSTRSEGNVIAASRNNGISLNSEAHDTTISGNFIGTDADGSNALPNLGHGISVGSTGNTIGGPGEEGNLISGNGQCRLLLDNAADSNSVWGNWIGLDASGQAALPNGGSGMDVYSSHNDIGGTSTNYGNIISGNQHDGICLESQAHDNRIWHNRIGPAADGTTLIGNQEDGIRFEWGGTSNTIGTINHPNYIAGNGGCGINLFFAGTGNSISDNRIYDNASLGISFNNGTPTANDAGDADTGSNNQQNYPVLNSATSDGTRIYFSGTLDSLPSTQFRIEIFGSRGGDTSGYGEGERRLTYFYVTTDAGGSALFTNDCAFSGTPPNYLSATATRNDGISPDTSEFSHWIFLDSDGDGLGDGFEAEYFGSYTGAVPDADSDGDGVSNYGEFAADTGPTDENDYPHFSGIQWTSNVVVRLPSSRCRLYTLEGCTNINAGGPWKVIRDNVTGNGGILVLEDTVPDPQTSYRLVVSLP